MPTYEIRVGRQRRAFLLRAPPDFVDLPWGSTPLIVGLHGGGQTPAEFYATTEMDRLMAGELTLDDNQSPVPQKFVAVFPQGLSLIDDIAGDWNIGWNAGEGALFDTDDVQAILEMVERADELLGLLWARVHGQVQPPDTPFFADAGILILGFSQGVGMAYRCASELPLRDTRWGMGALAPTCIAVAEGSAGGMPYSALSPWPYPDPPDALQVDLVRWTPNAPCSVLHMQSTTDQSMNVEGGVADTNRDNVDLVLGTLSGTAAFYRWDIRMGATLFSPLLFDPTVAPLEEQEAIGPWVSALPGGPVASAVTPVTLDPGDTSERLVWTWTAATVTPGEPTWAVQFVLWTSDATFNGGHYWPNDDVRDGWHATGEVWEFFVDLLY